MSVEYRSSSGPTPARSAIESALRREARDVHGWSNGGKPLLDGAQIGALLGFLKALVDGLLQIGQCLGDDGGHVFVVALQGEKGGVYMLHIFSS
jgi:hypothetical protein